MTTLAAKIEAVPYLDLPAQMRPIRKEIDAAIARTLDNCSFCLGPDVVQFEKDLRATVPPSIASLSTAAPPRCTSP